MAAIAGVAAATPDPPAAAPPPAAPRDVERPATPPPPPPPRGPAKRLIHFQPVAFTSDSARGLVSPRLCNPVRGWQAHVDGALRPLVARLGVGTFDWWGHRIGGSWCASPIPLDDASSTRTEFEQLDIARQRFPKLVDFAPLDAFADEHGIDLYGYVGFPRCDPQPRFKFTPRPEHGDPDQMLRWYGEFVRYGFRGVGHDWTQHLPEHSPVLTVNFPFLRAHGIEPFIEAVPPRTSEHLLGLSVVVTESRLLFTESKPQTFFTCDEIRAAGGRVVIIIAHLPAGTPGDVWQWRFERARTRLAQGHTVAVNLTGLARAGYPIEQLVELSRRPVLAPPPDRVSPPGPGTGP